MVQGVQGVLVCLQFRISKVRRLVSVSSRKIVQAVLCFSHHEMDRRYLSCPKAASTNSRNSAELKRNTAGISRVSCQRYNSTRVLPDLLSAIPLAHQLYVVVCRFPSLRALQLVLLPWISHHDQSICQCKAVCKHNN